MLQLLRESVCMDSKYYTDITDSAPESIKESMNKNPDVIKDNRLNESVSISDSEIKSAICQIKEAKTISDSIVNSVISKLRERGVSLNERKIYRVPIGRWDNVNGNRRKYTRKLWENVMNKKDILDKFKLEFPDFTITSDSAHYGLAEFNLRSGQLALPYALESFMMDKVKEKIWKVIG